MFIKCYIEFTLKSQNYIIIVSTVSLYVIILIIKNENS